MGDIPPLSELVDEPADLRSLPSLLKNEAQQRREAVTITTTLSPARFNPDNVETLIHQRVDPLIDYAFRNIHYVAYAEQAY